MAGNNKFALCAFFLSVLIVSGCGVNLALRKVPVIHNVPKTESGIRVVKTYIVVDPLWYKSDIVPIKLMSQVSDEWRREFGIEFEITNSVMRRISGINSIAKLNKLRDEFPANKDRELTVFFSGSSGVLFLETSYIMGNHIVISPGLLERTKSLIHHGLGHTFGIPHTLIPGEYMTIFSIPIITTNTSGIIGFCDKSKKAIMDAKWREFIGIRALAYYGHSLIILK